MACKNLITTLALLLSSGSFVAAQCERATAIAKYNNEYVASAVTITELAWTGDKANCIPGTISQIAQTRALARVNYYRELCGLPGNITFDASLKAKCQEAALMMTANGSLNHNPPSTWLCYTTNGASAASSSNLSSGSHSANAITQFMDDYGSNNYYVGHRRWILNSKATKFGIGSTQSNCALWVTGNSGPAATVDFFAFPAKGYFPAPLVPSSKRWSFSKPDADFTNATVEMKDQKGNPVSVTLEQYKSTPADETIVWVPTGIVLNNPEDVTYTVKVKNVLVNSVKKEYTYNVTICQATHPPACPTGMAWSDDYCSCAFPASVSDVGLKSNIQIVNPFTNTLDVTIATTPNSEIHCEVFNVLGEKMRGEPSTLKKVNSLELHWETADWTPGIYFVSIYTSTGEQETLKVMKQ